MSRPQVAVECPACSAEQNTDPIHLSETLRATNCPECGEWFTVYDGS